MASGLYQFPQDLDKRVKAQLAAGPYQSEDDVLREAADGARRA